jgi:hypothetical protein
LKERPAPADHISGNSRDRRNLAGARTKRRLIWDKRVGNWEGRPKMPAGLVDRIFGRARCRKRLEDKSPARASFFAFCCAGAVRNGALTAVKRIVIEPGVPFTR